MKEIILQIKELARVQSLYQTIPALIGVGFILNITQSFAIPFIIAVLLAVLLMPAVTFMEKKGIPSFIGTFIVLIGFFLVFSVLGLLTYNAIASISESLPKYYNKGEVIVDKSISYIDSNFKVGLRESIEKHNREAKGDDIITFFSSTSVVGTINESLGTFVTFLSDLLVMLLFLMFMLTSGKMIQGKLEYFMASRNIEGERGDKILHSMAEQIQRYLWFKTLISVGTGAAVWITAIITGLDFPLIWGFLAFIMNFIPSLGPIIASVPPILLAFFQFSDNILWAILVSILMVGIQFVSGNVIEPKIMGDKLNLNIIVVMLCLFVWGMIWGFMGMILAVPLTAVLNIILFNTKRYRQISVLLSN